MKNYLSKIFIQYLDSINFDDKSIIEILKAKDSKFGDYSTNIAMRLTKDLKMNPMDIAFNIKEFIINSNNPDIREVSVSKPGFINLFLENEFIIKNALNYIDEKYKPNFDFIKKKKINYEYVSANPTGDLHIGHARNAVVGDVSINTLKYVGHNVRTEYWVNDGGVQMKALAESVYFYYAPSVDIKLENLNKEDVAYHGKEIIEYAEYLAKKGYKLIGETEAERINNLTQISGDHFLSEIKKILHEEGLNIQKFDNWQSEKLTLKNEFPKLLANLKEMGSLYDKDGATWIKTKKYGDEKDRVLIKSDGTYTYMASDVAYHIIKLDNGNTDLMIDLWGKDHHGYEPRVQAALASFGMSGKMEVDFISMVQVMNNGEAFKMSKRAGTSLRIKDMLAQMNRDVFRYSLIMKAKEQNMEIDIAKLSEKDQNNPFYYAQYANARAHQILEKSNLEFSNKFDKLGMEEKERELMVKMIEFEDLIITMEKEREPSLIVHYQKELSQLFNSYYAECKVISDDKELSMQRLSLVKSVKNIFTTIFNLLGIEPINKL